MNSEEGDGLVRRIVGALPLAVIRMPHEMASMWCIVLVAPRRGVRFEGARWRGLTLDLEVVQTSADAYELSALDRGRRTVLFAAATLEQMAFLLADETSEADLEHGDPEAGTP